MMKPVRKAAVIGAGTMGAGIAAQFANGGVPVVLLDIAGSGSDRSGPARAGIERQLKSSGFMHADAARLVTPGTIDDDLGLLRDADWIVEVIVEDLGLKQALYRKLDAVRGADAIVSSNTSTIRLAALGEGLPEEFRRHFVITHFFNPPRQMPLVELVGGATTDPAILERARHAAETVLGKTVVPGRDTPGFIANRIGCYWLALAAIEAIGQGLTPEEADAIAGPPFGVPRTGVFGLLDLIGLDLIPKVWGSLMDSLPGSDGLRGYDLPAHPLVRRLIAEGHLGRKAGGGFYRQDRARKTREAVDLATGAYRPEIAADLPAVAAAGRDLGKLLASEDRAGAYAWRVFQGVLSYAAAVGPEIAESVAAIDAAMELGYGWSQGPFRLADAVGVGAVVERMAREGTAVPALLRQAARAGGFYADRGRTALSTGGGSQPVGHSSGLLSLGIVKDRAPAVASNPSASLWDLGDGALGLELTTKMNVFDAGVFVMIDEAIRRVPAGFKALVIGNEHPRAFSAGANLSHMLELIKAQRFDALMDFIEAGQGAFQALKFAPFPVVSAAFGAALGGGCEILLHSDAVVAHAELTAGLPETGVGLVPGWGGCTQMLVRFAAMPDRPHGPVAMAQNAFDLIAAATVSNSALHAKALGLLRAGDPIVMNRAQLLGRAKDHALALSAGYLPPEPKPLTLGGPTAKSGIMTGVFAQRAAGRATETDVAIAEVLSTVLTGGPSADATVPVPESAIYQLEREALTELTRSRTTGERIVHMLATGKPLRN